MSENNKHEVDEVEETEETVDETEEVEETDEVEETEEVAEKRSKTSSEKTYSEKEFKNAVEKRQRALREKRDLEKRLKQLEQQNESETERQVREATEKAEAEAAKLYKPVIVKNYVEKELIAAGVKPNKIGRLVRLMDMDDIEIDDKFNVDGVEEQIAALQEDYPELFRVEEPKDDEVEEKPKPKRKRAPRVEGSDKPAPKTSLTATEKLMGQLRTRR